MPRQGCAGRGAPAEPSAVCACACVQREGYCAPCVYVSAVGRGAVCAAGGAGLPACGGDRGSSLCVCTQGKVVLSVCVQGWEGGIPRELGFAFGVSVSTCHKDEDLQFYGSVICVCAHGAWKRVCKMRGAMCLVCAPGNKSSMLWLVCTFKGVKSLAVKLYYLGCSGQSFFPAQQGDVTSAGARDVCAVCMSELNVFTVLGNA